MARKEPEKAKGFVVEQQYTKCAADSACRFAGRLWIPSLPKDQRICVDHYYRALENDRSLVGAPTVPD